MTGFGAVAIGRHEPASADLCHMSRFLLLALLATTACVSTRPPGAGPAPVVVANPLANTYNYTAYTVVDLTEAGPPTEVAGVGGTLTLRPDGSYAKRLTIMRPGSTAMSFNQDGRYTVSGDSIRFAFTDSKGADVQRGMYERGPQAGALTITILGYPTGNRGIYRLQAPPAAR